MENIARSRYKKNQLAQHWSNLNNNTRGP